MSEKKYTPGPWASVDARNDGYGPVKDCPTWVEGDGWVIASVVGDVEYIDAQANARLISCAPKLLERLESIYNNPNTRYEVEAQLGEETWDVIFEAVGETP